MRLAAFLALVAIAPGFAQGPAPQKPASRPSPTYEAVLRRALALGARDEYPAAEAALKEALALAPERSEAHLKLGALYFKTRRYADSARAFERGLALAPPETGSCPWIGHAYHEMGELDRASEWYGKVLVAAPDNLEAKRGLALTLHKKGDAAHAEPIFRELAAKAKEGSEALFDAHRYLGEILLARGDAPAAILEFQQAKACDPFAPEAAYGLARAFARTGEPARAEEERARHEMLNGHRQEIEAFRARLRTNPGDFEAITGIATHQAAMGDHASAEKTLRRAIGLAPSQPERRLRLVDLLDARSRFDEARQALEEAASLFPGEASVFERAYRFHRARGDFEPMYRAAEAYHRLTGRAPQ